MNTVPGKTPEGDAAADTPGTSGEGAGSALEAMIRKRKLRAEDDLPEPCHAPEPPDPISNA